MKSKFIFSDLTLFHKIIYGTVQIKLPNYVIRIEAQDIKHATKSNILISKGTDQLKFKCNTLPKINAFKNCFFEAVE